MEIIKHGNKYRNQICDRCGCEFIFCLDEIKTEQSEIFHYYFVEDYIKCPECDYKIILDNSKIEI